jgi:hypothetical protein
VQFAKHSLAVTSIALASVLVSAAPVAFDTAAILASEQQNTVYNKQKQITFSY